MKMTTCARAVASFITKLVNKKSLCPVLLVFFYNNSCIVPAKAKGIA